MLNQAARLFGPKLKVLAGWQRHPDHKSKAVSDGVIYRVSIFLPQLIARNPELHSYGVTSPSEQCGGPDITSHEPTKQTKRDAKIPKPTPVPRVITHTTHDTNSRTLVTLLGWFEKSKIRSPPAVASSSFATNEQPANRSCALIGAETQKDARRKLWEAPSVRAAFTSASETRKWIEISIYR